ncbi:MAG: glycosyltransferase family 39 protein [Anaerolineaceae bacterium]|nr:glycosyltransferase family 39 protein [Anaerolineaceae bacterium]
MKYTLSFLFAVFIVLAAAFLPRRQPNSTKPPARGHSRLYFGALLLAFAAGAAVRLFRFGALPGGIFIDEAVIGYDAYALLHYGIDHNGFSYPVHLASFGSGQHALYAYLSMPFIAVLGLNAVSVRLVNLVFGLLSLGVFYLLVLRTDGRKTALAALFLLAVNPWHIMISRWGLECNLFPAVFLLATWLLVRALQGERGGWAAMLLYGLSLYAYGTAYFVVPVFLLMLAGCLGLHRRLKVRAVLGGGAILLAAGLPVGLYVMVNALGWNTLQIGGITIPRLPAAARFTQVFSPFSGAGLSASLAGNAAALARLLAFQTDGDLWNAIPGFGSLYLFGLPLAAGGLWACLQEMRTGRAFRVRSVFLLWLAAGILLALAMPVNINRANILFLPLIYLAARGLIFVWDRSKLLAGGLVLLCLVWFGLFVNAYFTVYPQQIGAAFNESLGEAIREASDHTDGTVYITKEVHLPYAYVLFYEQPPPYEFLNTVTYVDAEAEFRDAASFGRYRFAAAVDMPRGAGAYVIGKREAVQFDLAGGRVISTRLFNVLIPGAE